MKRQTTLTISCGRVLKAKAQTVIFTQVQSDDEDDKESVASSNYISNSVEENIAQTYHITLIEDGEGEEEDAEDAPAELEEGIKATIDELKEVNLGDIENPRPIYISASLTHGEEGTYVALLHEFKDVFAWSYKEMPGLDPKVAVHHLSVKKGARPVKQGQRRFRPELIPLIEGEVNKLIEVGSSERDLNNACPKDDFPLPIAELMIDATTGHEALSFMDGSSGYNQIRMAPADEELTAFRTPKAGRCQPFSRLMKKDVPFQWDEACDKAFKSIKSYLMKPPVLVAPVPGRPLILYVAAQERSVGILLAQKNDEGKENALYYLSRTMTPNEFKYSPIEKLCLALIFSIQKLKHYFQSHSIHLVSKANPLKYVMAKPVLSDRLARWYLQLQQFEITYVPQKAVKGQVLADFLADHPMPAEWELSDDLPDEDVLVIEVTPPWKMYFDGASHKEGAGAGVVFVTSEGENSLPRKDNKQADALAKLASTLSMTDKEARIPICKSWVIPPIFSDDEDDMLQEEENHVTEVFEVEEEDWRQPLVDYLKYGKLPMI
ncbi:UNVERIFIED_CONTAM: hypothetical protein Sradi_6603900 [Sesamum radiatum]|uniref:Reverse transcriptase RNase H-like domain-containing protein n=1 Tax=Sesamum radiatum TaxID=300843 RepID=A0AAW2K0T0_SESRA